MMELKSIIFNKVNNNKGLGVYKNSEGVSRYQYLWSRLNMKCCK